MKKYPVRFAAHKTQNTCPHAPLFGSAGQGFTRRIINKGEVVEISDSTIEEIRRGREMREQEEKSSDCFKDEHDISIEQIILEYTAEIWNCFNRLEAQHPMEKSEMCSALHRIQEMIGVRTLRRLQPNTWAIYSGE